MGVVNLERDFEYFRSVWEYKKSGIKHTSQVWDGRAADWEKELEEDGPFRRSLEERVNEAAEFLRSHGALESGTQVVDIGCGPGRFVTEFAKTAGHVTGIDISEKMLELGEKYAKECERSNVTFMAEDFGKLDIEALGWENRFDLVFTSITPAIGTMESLEKIMRISRRYCFNSCFVRWVDELEDQIGRDLFNRKSTSSMNSHGQWFYSLFNLLWLQGYFPETHYHCQNQEEYVDADEKLASYYAKCFSKDMLSSEELMIRVLEYLKAHADSNGKVLRKYERWYGWILWDVRMRMPRLIQEKEGEKNGK